MFRGHNYKTENFRRQSALSLAYLSTQVPGLLGHFIYCRIECITSFFTSRLGKKERDAPFSDSQIDLMIAVAIYVQINIEKTVNFF